MPVDQVCIGSCTNSSYKDLATVARIMKGHVAAPNVSLVIAPGSRQVMQNIEKAGYLGNLIASGARIDPAACGVLHWQQPVAVNERDFAAHVQP